MSKNFFNSINTILVTGGLGFIGSAYVKKILQDTNIQIVNIDKEGYASNKECIDKCLEKLDSYKLNNYYHYKADLKDFETINKIIIKSKPEMIVHFAAESHVDRSIDNPRTFLENNILGTFNILEATRFFYKKLSKQKKENFKFHHISTDEVYGSLGKSGTFHEKTPYNPRSPYSATKASSDHLVNAWFHTYGIPVIVSNCSNNFGPWQFPEKFIPLVILKALKNQNIPIYGRGLNVRDWLYVEDHVNALLKIESFGVVGESYCIGGESEISNYELVIRIFDIINEINKEEKDYTSLIKFVSDRPGHDFRYAIDSSKIKKDLAWKHENSLDYGLRKTIEWYINNLHWCNEIMEQSGYLGERIGGLN